MTEDDMRAKIATMVNLAQGAAARNPEEQKYKQLLITGTELLGELLIDIKRAATALEKLEHFR